jgi:hypothetical protein
MGKYVCRKDTRNYCKTTAGLSHTKSDALRQKQDREGWEKVAASLPDNAFADDVVVDDRHGTVSRKATIVESSLWHYD